MLDVGSGVYKECNFGAVLGNVHGYGCCLSSQWKQMPSKLLGWCSGRKSVGSTGGGEASCGFAICSFTEVGMPCSSNVAPKMAA